MTFDLRMKAHNANALRLAQFLEGHPRVARVLYPALPSHPAHGVAKRISAPRLVRAAFGSNI